MRKLYALFVLTCLSMTTALAANTANVNITNNTNSSYYCKPMPAPISGSWKGWQLVRPGNNPISVNYQQPNAQLFLNCHADPQKVIISPKHYVNFYMTFTATSDSVSCNSKGVSCLSLPIAPNAAQFILNPTK